MLQEAHFPFLALPSLTRERTTFYTALARVLFMNTDSELFNKFMEPILTVLTNLKTTIHVRSEKVHVRLCGWPCVILQRAQTALTDARQRHRRQSSVCVAIFGALLPPQTPRRHMGWCSTPCTLRISTSLAKQCW